MDMLTVLRDLPWKAILQYLGAIQDQYQLLTRSELDAGLRALKASTLSDREKDSLLREARNRFHQAISLEQGDRLAVAYVGLILCHQALGDMGNANAILEEFMRRDISPKSMAERLKQLYNKTKYDFYLKVKKNVIEYLKFQPSFACANCESVLRGWNNFEYYQQCTNCKAWTKRLSALQLKL